MRQFPFPRAPKPAETTLFIAGHGTERNENSRKAIERQAELIRAQKIYADVHAFSWKKTPRISRLLRHWRATKNIVVVPFFISDGLHVVEDIPVLLGEPERIVKERLAAGQPTWRNPTEKHGKLVWYSPSVGTEPLLADVILERVREARICPRRRPRNRKFLSRTRTRTRRITIEFMKKLRIGFLSTAGIGRKNWKAILNSGNCVVSAVASRDVEKSRDFIDECQREFAFAEHVPDALGSYEELIASPDVDAIYIPLPTGLRKEWVLRAAAAGKHILCEKPCATSAAELEEMLAACRAQRAIHGRRDVHAQPAPGESPRNFGRRPKRRPASAASPRRSAFIPAKIFSATTSARTARSNPPAASAISAGIPSVSRCGR